jgi:ribA/ribD-fused uncharacterized protein
MAGGFPLRVDGVLVPSAEALYQACRFPHRPEVQSLIIKQHSPMTAKMVSKPYRDDSRGDWLSIRIRVMRWVLRVKLAMHWSSFGRLLLATEDCPIVEDSRRDDFWGAIPQADGSLAGANVLGRLLMELREELKASSKEALKSVSPPPIVDFLLLGNPIGPVGFPNSSAGAAADPDLHPPQGSLWGNVPEIIEQAAEKLPGAEPRSQTRGGMDGGLEQKQEHSQPVSNFPMPDRYPKRLIEVDLPIRRISDHARREKSIRHGHISTLHIWWARRPLAACRAVLCAALWPDPVDERCPRAFQLIVAERMWRWAREERARISAGSASTFDVVRQHTSAFALTQHPTTLRQALLDFIADFANWDSSTVPAFLDTARALTAAAHHGLSADAANAGFVEPMDEREWLKTLSTLTAQLATSPRPLVVDPFAGGGSIPLEALRIGADAFASDLNPVAVLLNKAVLEYLPRHGRRLAEAVREWGAWVKDETEKELARFYPRGDDGSTPIAYLWARTIRCEGPGCGTVVPLLRSLWLAKKAGRSVALQLVPRPEHRRCDPRIIVKTPDGWVAQDDSKIKVASPGFDGTVKRGSATCPCCGYTTPVARVREQLRVRHGGTNDAQMYCVVTESQNGAGRRYRLPFEQDKTAFHDAAHRVEKLGGTMLGKVSAVPDEKIADTEPRRISVPAYGMTRWRDLFNQRQLAALVTLCHSIRRVPSELRKRNDQAGDEDFAQALQLLLSFCLGRCADKLSSQVVWHTGREFVDHVFARQAIPIVWEYAEANFFTGVSITGAIEWVCRVIEENASAQLRTGTVVRASATKQQMPDDSADAVVTDPPYYYSVPYSHLADFFYVWHKRAVGDLFPEEFGFECSPKDEECVQDLPHAEVASRQKDRAFYEQSLGHAFSESRRVARPNAIGVVVFAHTDTNAWESLIAAMIKAGWMVTGSWPIDTEMTTRLLAKRQSSLASSVHIVCRPREAADGSGRTDEVGDWRDVLAELPRRIHEWMPRLAEEGVVGADAIFACLGPALEIFSRYARVEKASGDPVPLREYLEHVWAAVALEALSLVFAGASAEGFEPDARLTAMWLWTLNAPQSANDAETGDDESDDADDDTGATGSSKKAPKGFALEFDSARMLAQGLGAHLEALTHLVEVKGDQARLLSVSERTRHLFGKDQEASPLATTRRARPAQGDFFAELSNLPPGSPEAETAWGEKTVTRAGDTTLDRVHQAMILFAASRGEALRRFLVEDAAGRDAKFWRLAQALSALYPKACEEKRWVDGVLARKKGLGL